MSNLSASQDTQVQGPFEPATSVENLQKETISYIGGKEFPAYVFFSDSGNNYIAIVELPTVWGIATSPNRLGPYTGRFLREQRYPTIEDALQGVQDQGLVDVSEYLANTQIASTEEEDARKVLNNVKNNGNSVSISDKEVESLPPIRHTVESTTAGDFEGDGTFFKIGPHIYGGEVQDIKIIEQKAIQRIQGVRTNSDFLVDSGEGTADVQVTMLFSGIEHIKKSLLPLIALFRISPITSVRNNVINGALYDDFTEDQAKSFDEIVSSNYKEIIKKDKESQRQGIFKQMLQGTREWEYIKDTEFIDEDVYNTIKVNAPNSPVFEKFPTYSSLSSSIRDTVEDSDTIRQQNEDILANAGNDQISRSSFNYKKDLTGYVPMAMTKIAIQTHPELINTLVVRLSLRRIDMSNYLRNFLQYRTSKNTPTPNPTEAYWLRRGLDLYLDRYLPEDWVELGDEFNLFGDVVLKFAGEDIVLDLFKKDNRADVPGSKFSTRSYGLDEDIVLNSSIKDTSVVTQLGYAVENKFAFHRLEGKSYPTAQFMGSTSGIMSISIRTADPGKFKQIHSYKSAADFFVRTSDRLTRFNGWEVKSFLTRMFNTHPDPETRYSKSTNSKTTYSSFYPSSVVSETNSDNPKLRDINIVFNETTPDFFQEFGFSVEKGGYTLTGLREFFMETLDRAFDSKFALSDSVITRANTADLFSNAQLDRYSYNTFFGHNEYGVFNIDTLTAGIVQNRNYSEGSYGSNRIDEISQSTLDFLANSRILSGGGRRPTLLEEIEDIVAVGITAAVGELEEVLIPEDLANDIVDKYFSYVPSPISGFDTIPNVNGNLAGPEFVDIPDIEDIVSEQFEEIDYHSNKLKSLIRRITTESGRQRAWEYIINNRFSFTQAYREKLFAAIVRRELPESGDRIYDISGLVNAYNNLALALEAKGREIIGENRYDGLAKGPRNERRVGIGKDGTNVRLEKSSSYVDYPFFTYEEVFDASTELKGNWINYSPTFDELGILNLDTKFFEDDFSSSSVNRAQGENVAAPDSPVPPSIWFYSGKELQELRTGIDKEHGDWFDQLKTARLHFPFDIERILRDTKYSNKYTGERKNIEGIADDIVTAPSLIEKIAQQTAAKLSREKIDDVAEDLILQMAKDYGRKFDHKGSLSDSQRKDFAKELKRVVNSDKRISDTFDTSNISVPFLIGTHIDTDVVRWEPLTGIFGEKVLRTLIRASRMNSIGIEEFVDQTLTKSAAGFDDGITISSANEDENRIALLKATQATADNADNAIKAFPTMRLYLIDHVGPRIVVQDNFYGLHAIESIDITLDKNDAGLAVIRIADPFHILQGSTFGNEFAFKESQKSLKDIVLPASVEDITSGDYLDRIKLKQGRAIQIRGGYSSDPENLDILFTGKISEIQFGDVVTIIAQDWKSELIGRQVNFELQGTGETSVKDLIVTTVRQASPAGIGQQYSRNEAQRIYELSSDLASSQQILFQSALNNSGTAGGIGDKSFAAGTRAFSPLGIGVFRQAGKGLDTRLKNIWVPDNDGSRWDLFAERTAISWEGAGWVVPTKPAWECLQDATNYVWNYIAQVVPYDGEATLFFGKPDQMYFYTSGNHNNQRKWNESRARTIEELQNSFDFILQRFYRSNEFYKPVQFLESQAIPKENKGKSFLYEPTSYYSNKFKTEFDVTRYSVKVHDYIFGIYRGTRGRLTDDETNSLGYGVGAAAPRGFTNSGRTGFDNEFQEFMYRKSFVDRFETIASLLGSYQTAAIFLVSKFYGFNPNYVSEKLNAVSFVENLLKKDFTKDKNFIEGLRQTAKRTEDIQDALNEVAKEIVSLKDAETILERINEIKPKLIELNPALRYEDVPITSRRGTYRYLRVFATASGNFDEDPAIRELQSLIANVFIPYTYRTKSISPDRPKKNGWLISFEIDKADRVAAELGSKTVAEAIFDLESALYSIIASYKNKNQLFSSNLPGGEVQSVLTKLKYKAIDFSKNDWNEDVVEFNALFRSFVYFFSEWLTRNVLTGQTDKEEREELDYIKNSKVFDYRAALNMKVFRDYHYVRSGVDIIENNVGASTREMSNTVIVRHPREQETSNNSFVDATFLGKYNFDSVEVSPETEWETWPAFSEKNHVGMQFDETVSLKDKKVIVHTDLNATRREQCAKVATSVLTKAMRPMYRNNLLIMGRPIKPWDFIWLDDKFNDIFGPLDVERVVHHYSADKGWCTNIVPHAVCDANPGNKHVQAAVYSSRIDRIMNIVDYASWALIVGSFAIPVGAPLASAASQATRIALGNTLKTSGKVLGREGITKLGTKALASTLPKSGLGKASLTNQLKTVGSALATAAPAALRTFTTVSVLEGGVVSPIARYLIRNAGSDNQRLPVIFCPLIYKGAPLQAGLQGEDVKYSSLASKFFWGWQDFTKGVRETYSTIGTIFSPEPTFEQVQLENLADFNRR